MSGPAPLAVATPQEAVGRLRLLASSIAGTVLDVRATDATEPSWTDGCTIYVDPSADARAQVRAVAVQASLIAAGSLEPEILRRLVGRPALTRRYLAVEAPRALVAIEDRLPPAASALAGRITPLSAATAEDSLAAALAASGRPELPADFGELRPRAALSARPDQVGLADAPADSGQRQRPDPQASDTAELDESDTEGLLDSFLDPAGGGGRLGRLLSRAMRFARDPASGALGADVPPRARMVAGRPGRGRGGHGRAAGLDDTQVSYDAVGWVYPEWDVRRGAYRHDWCTVSEEEPAAGSTMPKPGPHRALRRPLSRLGLGLELSRRRLQGDDLDIDAAIEARVEMLAGVHPEETVYLESLRRRHELSALVLLDISGSANEPSGAGGSVHDQQLAGTTALVQALHALGNRVAVYGFYSQGRAAVRVVRVKRFADGMDARALRRLSALEPGGYTRLGAAIRHGSTILEREAAGSRQLLVVLSDGFAYDQGYAGRYGEADARRALIEARRQGVGCLCLSIGATTDLAALRRVFGSAAHGTVRRPEDLTGVVGPLLRDALRSAEVQRSAVQRRSQTSTRRSA